MRTEELDRVHDEGEVEEHPEGADRGGHVQHVSGGFTYKTQIGTICVSYSYRDLFNDIDKYNFSVWVDNCLPEFEDRLKDFCSSLEEKEPYASDLESWSFEGEFEKAFEESDEDDEDEDEDEDEEDEDEEDEEDEKIVLPEAPEEKIAELLAWIGSATDPVIDGSRVIVYLGSDSYPAASFSGGFSRLMDLIWENEEFYYWYDSLTSNPEVQAKWQEVCKRIKEQIESAQDEIEAARKQHLQDAAIAELRECLLKAKSSLQALPEETILQVIRELHVQPIMES